MEAAYIIPAMIIMKAAKFTATEVFLVSGWVVVVGLSFMNLLLKISLINI
jgi:hypothetical protein